MIPPIVFYLELSTTMEITTSQSNLFNQWRKEEERYISKCPYETIDILKIALQNALDIPLDINTHIYCRRDRIFFLHLAFNLYEKLINTDSRFHCQKVYRTVVDRYDVLTMDMKTKGYTDEAVYMEYRFLPLYQKCKQKIQNDTLSDKSQVVSYTTRYGRVVKPVARMSM